MPDLITVKEKIDRLRFFFDELRYRREKHLYLAVFILVLTIGASSTGLYLYQDKKIKTQENILKSYYADFSQTLGKGDEKISAGLKNAGILKNKGNAKKTEDQENIYITEDNNNVPKTGSDGKTAEVLKAVKIKVYICGYVVSPGVYELDAGARVIDLVELGGGVTENAALEVINLAAVLEDSDMVYIPSIEEVKEKGVSYPNIKSDKGLFITSGASTKTESQTAQTQCIDLNQASIEELALLPGVGEVIALNIIEYREKYGGFKTIDELKNVKGIGEKKYENIKDMISI